LAGQFLRALQASQRHDPHNDKDLFLNSVGSLKERLITKLLDPLQGSSRTQKWRSSTSFCSKGSLERLRFVVDQESLARTCASSFGRPRFPKTLNQQLRVGLPAPGNPRRYCECGIGLKHMHRRFTLLSVTSEMSERASPFRELRLRDLRSDHARRPMTNV